MKAAGLSGLTFHGLRYMTAARLAEAGCSLREIAAKSSTKEPFTNLMMAILPDCAALA